MEGPPLNAQQLERFVANLAALAADQPELARRLQALDLPPSVTPLAGRDGAETFRLAAEAGRWRWFGRSSMPTVSAPALVGGFASDGHNVVVPAFGTGYEARILLERSPRHCAVFVFDRDLTALKLGLHLHDFSPAIEARRLVLLHGADIGGALVAFLSGHPGFEFPQRMLGFALLPPGEQERSRLEVESAGPRVVLAQTEAARRAAAELRAWRAAPAGDAPAVVLLSRDPRADTLELAAQLEATLGRMGWPCAACVPDRPDRCHTVARLETVLRGRPALAVLVNCLPGPLRRFVPAGLPICSWLITADSAGALLAGDAEGGDPVFVSQPDMVDRLSRAGLAAARIHLLEPGVDPATFGPLEPVPDQGREGCRIVVLADGADVRPAAVNMSLASHERCWEAIRKATAGLIGGWQDEWVFKVLERASRASGVELPVPGLGERFAEIVRQRLVPTLLARATVERLCQGGGGVEVWGSGWESHPAVAAHTRGPIPGAAGRNRLYNTADVVVFPVYHERAVRLALECLAAGGSPLLRAPQRRPDHLHPQLAPVLEPVPLGGSPDEVAEIARGLAADPQRRERLSSEARALLGRGHTLEHRLRAIHAAVATA